NDESLLLLERNPGGPVGVLIHAGQERTVQEAGRVVRVAQQMASLELPAGGNTIAFSETCQPDERMQVAFERAEEAGRCEPLFHGGLVRVLEVLDLILIECHQGSRIALQPRPKPANQVAGRVLFSQVMQDRAVQYRD